MGAKFNTGDYVEKTGGDYQYRGWVSCWFYKRSGAIRYVVENADGMLFIFNESQLAKATAPGVTNG